MLPIPPWLSGAVARSRAGVWRVDLFPQSVAGIADLLLAAAQPTLVLTDVDYIIVSRRHRSRGGVGVAPLARLAPSATAYPEQGAVVLAGAGLPGLLGEIVHWNLHCWDTSRPPGPVALARQTAAVAHWLRGERRGAVLPRLGGARWFVDSHDDDELSVEAAGRQGEDLVRALVARAIGGLVARALAGPLGRLPGPPVEPVSAAVLEHLWETLPVFELRAGVAPGKLGRIRVVFGAGEAGPGRGLRRSDFTPHGHVDYDPLTARWWFRYS